MVHHRTQLCMVWSISLLIMWVGIYSANAQGEQTTQQMFGQGMEQYEQGDYASARATFQKLDVMQLNRDQRVTLYEVMQQIDSQLTARDESSFSQTPPSEERHPEVPPTSYTTYQPSEDGTQTTDNYSPVNEQVAPVSAQDSASGGQQTPSSASGTGDLLGQLRTLRIQEKVAAAAKAENAGQYHLAVRHYREALGLDPQNPQLAHALASVEAKMTHTLSPRGVLDTEIKNRSLRAKAAVAEFKLLMNRALSLLDEGNHASAREAVQQAKITLDLNQRFLPIDRYRTLREDAVNLATQITDYERFSKENEAQELEASRRAEAQRRRSEATMAQADEIRRLLQRAVELRREQKYDQALELLNQALFLDPTNVVAQAMKEMVEDTRLLVQSRDRLRGRALRTGQQASDNIEASIPYTDLLQYPADWPQLSANRFAGLERNIQESEINRRVALKLKDSVPINFDANQLENVINYMRQTTSVNFFINWPALEALGVEKDMPISLSLTNVPAEQALRLVLQQVSAAKNLDDNPISFSIIEGIVTISTERDLNKTTDIRLYDIRDLLVQAPNFLNAPVFDLNEALSNTASGGSTGSSSKLFGDDEEIEERLTRDELIEQYTNLIQDNVGNPDEWAALGGTVSSVRELNGLLIVKSTPENHRRIDEIFGLLRETRTLQIAVEGRFLLVDQNFLEEVGVDLDIHVADPGGSLGPISIAQDSVSLAQSVSTGIAGSFGGVTSTDSEGDVIPPGPGGYTGGSGFPSRNRSFDFGLSFMDDVEVNLLIKATQADRRAFTLTAPRLTLFNGQRAYVVVANQFTFVSDLEPIPNSGGFDTTLSVTQSGVILDVEGTVSADRRYVTLTVRPSLADLKTPIETIGQSATIVIPGFDIPTTTTAFIQTPELELTALKTTVSVPDRGTLLLGGQRLMADVEVEAGVPVLSKIPVLNRLFTNRSTVKDERTLLILVKPTIIIQSEEEEQMFPGLLQESKQLGVGNVF